MHVEDNSRNHKKNIVLNAINIINDNVKAKLQKNKGKNEFEEILLRVKDENLFFF